MKKMKKKNKIVFIQGSFDILNARHVRSLRDAKSKGDYLIVALNTDALISRYKNRQSIIPFKQRKIMLLATRYVDKVVPIGTFGCLPYLKKYKVDVYINIKEWESTHQKEFNYIKKSGGTVILQPNFPSLMCSTDIRNKIINLWQQKK